LTQISPIGQILACWSIWQREMISLYSRGMPYTDGQPLSRVLSGQPLPAGTVVAWALQVARALSAVHKSGKVHRDIKPANILVDRDGTVHLLDSGLPSWGGMDPTLEGGVPVLMGAPQYMSPEQVRGEPLDTRSDVFSLGVVLYEMAAGKRPFSGASSDEILAEILRARPIPPNALAPSVPEGLERLIQKALSPQRADRHQTMEELVTDLEGVADELESESTPQRGRRISDRRRPVLTPSIHLLAVGVVVIFALALVTGLALRSWLAPTVYPNTVLIVPMEVRGQTEGAEYLGRSFAEAIAVNLAQAPDLRVLPVPQSSEFLGISTLERAVSARAVGAGRMLTGSVTRHGERVVTTLSLIDSVENRIVWGTDMEAAHGDISALASAAARRVAMELGVTFPKLYDYVGNLSGSPAMAASELTGQALDAMRQGRIRPLLVATRKLVRAFPAEPDALTLRAHALMLSLDADPTPANRRALERSITQLDTADPQNPYGQLYRAYLLFRDVHYDQALVRYSTIVARDDLTPAMRAWVLRRRAFIKTVAQQGTDAALEDLEEALHLDPTSAFTFHILSTTLLSSNRYEEALARARQAVALMPSYWRHHETLGVILAKLERHEEALEAFSSACKLGEAQSACARYAIGLLRSGRTEEAHSAASRASTFGEDAQGAYNLACFWALANDEEKALRLLRRAIDRGFSENLPSDDPDLASLYEHPEFLAIVAKAKAKKRRVEEFPP
jgi:serine/threonine-protein kinase